MPFNLAYIHDCNDLFSSCRYLDLSNNKLVRISEGILQLRHLRTLKLSRNQIAVLPASISSLSKLKHLHLSHNFIAFVPDGICTLINLESLLIDSNRIMSLPTELSKLSGLLESDGFNVENNPLTNPPAEVCHLGLEMILYYQQHGKCPDGVLEKARNSFARQKRRVRFETY